MSLILLPAIWLIVLIVGLPQLSETVYTPSMPDIAYDLQTSEAMVEYTLTIYLLGFAIDILFFGKISDKLGRKPCVIAGLGIFIIGCIGCYFSSSIEMLMMSRLIQAFGGSIGSVIGRFAEMLFMALYLGESIQLLGVLLPYFQQLVLSVVVLSLNILDGQIFLYF